MEMPTSALCQRAPEASKTDDLCRVPITGTRHTSISNSTLHRRSDANRYKIFVSTDILRESSDSSGVPTESPFVETATSSSLRHKSPDLSHPLQTPPQHKSLYMNRPLPSIPNSNSTQTSPSKTGSSHRSSVMSRTSVSNPDFEIVECAPIDILGDILWDARDNKREAHGQCDASLTSLSPTDFEILRNEMLADNASSGDPTHPEPPRDPYSLLDTISPGTLAPTADSPASNFVSPISPNSGLSSLFSKMSTPTSPVADVMFPPPNVVLPVLVTREYPDLGTVQYHDDAARGFPSQLELATQRLEYKRSASNAKPSLPTQRPVLHKAVSSASGAQWTQDSMPEWHFQPSHRHEFEALDVHSVCTQPCFSRMESYDLAGSIYSSGIDELMESETPSAGTESILVQFDESDPSNPVFVPSVSSSTSPEQNIDTDCSFNNGSMATMRAEMAAPISTQLDMNAGDHDLYKLPPPVGGDYPSPLFSPPYPSGTRSGVALCRRRRMNVPPLPLSRTDIASSMDDSEEAMANPLESTAPPRCLTRRRVLSQSQSTEGQMSIDEVAVPEDDLASAHRCFRDISNALDSLTSIKTLPHCFDHGSLLVTHSASKQTQIEELQALTDVVNRHWMQRLESDPDLRHRCSVLSPRALFEKGVRTLREFFCGRFAQSFEDVFAFMNLTFAAALLLHLPQHNLDRLNAFYDDALQWQHTLSDEIKVLFLKAMDRWCWLSEPQPPPLLNSGRYTGFGGINQWDTLDYSGQTDLLDVLRNNEVIKGSISFLEGKLTFMPCKTYSHHSN